jgi:hypothetical protein
MEKKVSLAENNRIRSEIKNRSGSSIIINGSQWIKSSLCLCNVKLSAHRDESQAWMERDCEKKRALPSMSAKYLPAGSLMHVQERRLCCHPRRSNKNFLCSYVVAMKSGKKGD